MTEQVTHNEDYHSTLFHLKKHHQSRVMPENNNTSVADILRERVVSSGSPRRHVESQGTTGLLNIIDQNNQSVIGNKPTTSNFAENGQRLVQHHQLVFDNLSHDAALMLPHKIQPSKNIMGTTHTTQFSKTGGDGYDRLVSGVDLMSGESIIHN